MELILSEDQKPTVVIGSKYKGPNAFMCTTTGTHWAVMPMYSADEELLQRALIAHRKMIDKKIAKAVKRNSFLTDEQIEDFKKQRIS